MKTHYVIVGNGVAGMEAAVTIRERFSPRQAKITLISEETPYFFSRTALMYAYMDRLDRRDLEPYERAAYDRRQIERIQARVVDLDGAAARITLEDGRELAYDRLLIACGARPRMVDFGGIDEVKEGLVHFVSMQDLEHCERLTWSTRQATVVGGGLIGVELAECFLHHGLEVSFLVREPYFWPAALGAREGQMITDHIRSLGVDIRHDESLAEIAVDTAGRVRALHTDRGEELPAQMLGVCIGVVANVAWLQEVATPPAIGEGLRVNRAFQTSLDGVYGAGDCVEIDMGEGRAPLVETIWYSAKRHGELAAKAMMGDSVHYEPPVFFNSAKFFGVEYTTVGDFHDLPPGSRSLYRRMPSKKVSQRIAYDPEGRVLGFNMLGSRWDHRILMRWIEERRDIEFVREKLKEAQFDVEFGRADLTAMTEVEEEI